MFFTQTWRVVRLTAFLLLVLGLHVTAKTVSQTVTYSGDNVPLKQLFSVIEQQTGVVVFYENALLVNTKPVTIKADQTPLLTFLQTILRNQPLSYTIKGETIFIAANEKSITTSAQKAQPITGIVRGPDGQPISGANVQIKGADKGVVTDNNGHFSIDVEEGSTLVISNVGYKTKEIKISGANVLVVDLAINANPLDEVQIIAYGQTSQRLSTGNVQSVKAKDIEKQPVGNPILALQGRIPGITIQQATGLPGSGINVQIQGQISLFSGALPLYVVDGVPVIAYFPLGVSNIYGSNGQVGPVSVPSGTGSALSLINPVDIESISVLKDADATSIYGSRAAAGAILITTKKGKAGKTKVDVSIQTGWGKAANLPELMNTQQYLAMRKAAFVNNGLPIPDASTPESDKNSGNYDLTMWDQNRNTDWKKELLGGSAEYTNVQSTISGGNANTQFLLSGNYNAQGTVFPNSNKVQMMSGHFNVNNISTNKKFHSLADIKYSINQNNLANVDLTGIAMSLPPNAPSLYSEAGELNWETLSNGFATWGNPLAQLNNKAKILSTNFTANTILSYEILQGLEVKTSLDYTDLERHEHRSSGSLTVEPAARSTFLGGAFFGESNIRSWQIQPQVTLDRKIFAGDLQLLAGGTFNNIMIRGQILEGHGYTTDLQLESYSAAPQKSSDINQINSNYKYLAAFGRLNYNLKDKYIVNINYRRDGSSRFGGNNRFHNFASGAAAWIFSQEKLFSNTIKFFSYGKVKASYGTTGNDQIGEYAYLSLYNVVNAPNNYQGIVGYSPANLPNSSLQWEETRKLSASLELGFLQDRILISATYFRNRSSNQLLNYSLPPSSGSGGLIQNFPALLQNSGSEFLLSATPIQRGEFTWTTNLNFTIPRNKLVDFPGIESSSYANTFVVGQPFIGNQKIFQFAGIDPITGLYTFKKADGSITSSDFDFTKDRLISVYMNAKMYGGWQNTFTYKKISLDFLFQYSKQLGRKISSSPLGRFSSDGSGTSGNQPTWNNDYWQKPGDIVTAPKPSQDFSGFLPFFLYQVSDASYVDASYVRLKNLSLSYELPHRWKNVLHAENVKVFAQGQNLVTITAYPMDPESSLGSLPPLRVVTIGFQITF